MLDDAKNLPDDPSELKDLVTLLARELKNRDLKIADLKHQLAGHNRHRFGSKSESLDQLQLALENEEIALAAVDEVEPSIPEPTAPEEKAKPRRKPLPDHLDRRETVITPGDACAKCGGNLKTLGEDITEELEYIPGGFVVNRFVRPRMACACCEAICQAPLPSRPPRCTAHSKRTGLLCKSPAVRGWTVCRMLGARGGHGSPAAVYLGPSPATLPTTTIRTECDPIRETGRIHSIANNKRGTTNEVHTRRHSTHRACHCRFSRRARKSYFRRVQGRA